MDSDDEIMFCQLVGVKAAFADDDENEMVMAALLEAMAVEATVTALGCYRKVLQNFSQIFTFAFDHAS